jgi:hypothetical protein
MTFVANNRAVDPAEQAALLLFRIGLAILCIILPIAAVFSRRALVIIAPIGAIILIMSAFMMKGRMDAVARIKSAIMSPAGLAALFLVIWSAVSLLWTPFPGPAAERLFRIVGTIGLAIGAIIALPQRMRASNLYLLAVGVGLSALTALGVVVAQTHTGDPTVLERAAVLITLLAWPAVTWLSIKQRSIASMGVAGGVGALAIVLQGPAVLPALLMGAILLGGAMNNLRASAVAFMSAVTVLVMGAPLIALLLSLLTPQESGFGRTMQIWADVILADPTRLLTGHGLETALRNRISQTLDTSAPNSLLFEIWYELGLLGAMAITFVIVFSVEKVSRLGRALGPFALGCMGFAFSLSIIGLSTSQTWWLTALATTCIAFAAVMNGEYRSPRVPTIKERE